MYSRGDIMSIYPKLALYSSKNKCARTDTVFFPISQVCTRGVTLKLGSSAGQYSTSAVKFMSVQYSAVYRVSKRCVRPHGRANFFQDAQDLGL